MTAPGTARSLPVASVVVVNWNSRELLRDCLTSLLRQTLKDIEVIVVDNGSTDGSVELVKTDFPEACIIPLDQNLGFSVANNIGIQHASGKYIALLNNDTEVDPHWLEELVKALESHPDIGFCASKMLVYGRRDLVDACGDFYSIDGTGGKIGHLQPAALYNEPQEVFGACAGAAIYRRELLEELGGFDEDFFLAHEDTDLSFRAQLRGYRCLYVPTAIVYHRVSATIGADSDTYIYYGHRNAEFVYIKNMPGPLLWRSLISHLALITALLIFYMPRGKARPYLRAKFHALRALPTLLRKRRAIQSQRRVSIEHIAGLLEESWLRQAVRKKLGHWRNRATKPIRNWGRRILPYSWKERIKRVIPSRPEPPRARIPLPLPLDPLDEVLRPWSEDPQLMRTLERLRRPDRQVPRVDVILLTHNHLPYTRLCIESLFRYTQYANFGLIVIDNASTDGTRAYLEALQRKAPNFRSIFNERNEGFARANNQGILCSYGDYVVLLNNDTIVGPGWLSGLIRHLERDDHAGMVGPTTNAAGNEQMIAAPYATLEALETFARQRASDHEGQGFEIEMLAMFCVAIPRRIIDEVGLLDERFERGTFEDDDYCHRVKLRGYRLICAEDVYVHHFERTTMGQLGKTQYLEHFERNKRLFEQKWQLRWRPQRLRTG